MAITKKKPAAKKKKPAAKKKELPLELVPSLQSKTGRLYSNWVQVSHNPWDFTLRFCDAPPGADVDRLREGKTLILPTVAEIIIPVNLMPGLIEALQVNHEKYLKLYGAKADEAASKPGKGKGTPQLH